jgi:hypothetical protein
VAPLVDASASDLELQQDVASAFRAVLLLFDGLE